MIPSIQIYTRTSLLICVFILTLSSTSATYRFPAGVYTDLAKSVKITSSHSCNSNGIGYTCVSDACPSTSRRSLVPKLEILRDDIPDECRKTSSGLPSHVSQVSAIYINSSLILNCTITKPVTSFSSSEFSISLWIKQTCGTCDILQLKDGNTVRFKLSLQGNYIKIGSVQYIQFKAVSQGEWHHIIIRETAFFIDGQKNKFNTTLQMTSVSRTLEIKSGSGLSGSEYMNVAGVKLYDYRVTDRDVQLLWSNTLPFLTDTNCRCPNDFPQLDDPNDPQGILCRADTSSATGKRLNPLSRVAGFANDGDPTTSWISGQQETATLTLTLDNNVQIRNITINLRTKPTQTTIDLAFPGHSRRFTLTSSDITSSNELKIDLKNEITALGNNRTHLENTLAQTITITFSGHVDGKTYFEVSEIDVEGRCNCYGNSDTCTRPSNERTFTCQSCNPNTFTTGSNCQNCQKGYFRNLDDFGCATACLCNSEGIIGSDTQICKQVGGQCPCKLNVAGRQCSQCKHLTYKFDKNNTDGCTKCSCDAFGSDRCDTSTGQCFCKNNILNTSSDCSQCKAEFYGRQKHEGCVPCNCNISGVQNNNLNCDEFRGNCSCKEFVTGQMCDMCKDGYYSLDHINSKGCKACVCNTVGSVNQTCDKRSGDCHCKNQTPGDQNCNPKIATLEPKFGPVAGGTVVEVKGTLFGTDASKVVVYYRTADPNPQLFTLTSINDTKLVFTTHRVNKTGQGKIIINWKASLKTTGVTSSLDKQIDYDFIMKPNPTVTKATSVKAFKSFSCGVDINGSNLDSVYKPTLIVYFLDGSSSEKECHKPEGNTVKCGVPNLTSASNNEVLTYGLKLDGLMMYKNLTSMFRDATITVSEDPEINKVDKTIEFRYPFMKTITIKGSRFTEACAKSDFKVKIGEVNCRITEFQDSSILCEPDVQFPGTGTTENLTLYIGDKPYKVGMVEMVVFWSSIEFIGIASGVGGFIVLIIVLIVIIKCCCCHKEKKKKNFDDISRGHENNACDVEMEQTQPRVVSRYTPMPSLAGNGKPSESENDTNTEEEFLQRLDSTVSNQLETSLIKRKDIDIEKRCTKKGSEIRIIDGKYSGRKSTIKTLIKTLSSYKESEPFYKLMQSGITECLRLRDCFHDNILQIYGVSVDQDRFYIVYPTTKRVLKDHLNDVKGQTFQVVDLVRMCREIAEGMVYLDTENIVHKDLATRNCFVTVEGAVKICDASFSWDLYPKEYMYDNKKERYIPVRWMAPECLQSSFYDKKTDVWSFGVVMWETMSRSNGLPYWDVKDNEKISNHVMDGNRLGKPAETPENLYQLMLNCWQHDSNYRPDMNNIVNQLVMIENPEDFDSSGLYQNVEQNSMGPPPSLPPRSDQIYGNIP